MLLPFTLSGFYEPRRGLVFERANNFHAEAAEFRRGAEMEVVEVTTAGGERAKLASVELIPTGEKRQEKNEVSGQAHPLTLSCLFYTFQTQPE
jgi:hypothetical protein